MSDFTDTGAAYAASFALLTAGVVDAVLDAAEARSPSGALLDVGAGTGALVGAARRRGYRVSAAEPEDTMIEVLHARHPDVDIAAAGLPALPYADGTFDAVAANFVLNHVDDPRASARELVRVARPGGAVVATVWPAEASPLRPLWAAMTNAVAGGATPRTLSPDLDFDRSEEGLAELLRRAGLRGVSASAVSWTWEVDPATLWRAVSGGIAAIGNLYRRCDAPTRERMRAIYDRETAARVAASGLLVLPHTAVLAVGVR